MNVCQMMCDGPYDDREQCEDCDIYTAGQTFLKFIKKNLKRRR